MPKIHTANNDKSNINNCTQKKSPSKNPPFPNSFANDDIILLIVVFILLMDDCNDKLLLLILGAIFLN